MDVKIRIPVLQSLLLHKHYDGTQTLSILFNDKIDLRPQTNVVFDDRHVISVFLFALILRLFVGNLISASVVRQNWMNRAMNFVDAPDANSYHLCKQ